MRRLNWQLDLNWQGVVVALALLALLLADLALFGETALGAVGAGVIVVVCGAALRFELGPRWLHR